MIGLISGKITYLSSPIVCVLSASGVGYEIELPLPTFYTLTAGDEVTLYTHLHVREDAHLLFGFTQQQDRDLFRKLIKINGVGAKMALAMLSALSATEIRTAVEHNDDSALVRVPGIGKKTAQRLIIELKGKLLEFGDVTGFDSGEFVDQKNPMHVIAEVETALISLGYKEKEAQSAIKTASPTLDTVTTTTLLKASLKVLSGI